jgi:hypothetical protein
MGCKAAIDADEYLEEHASARTAETTTADAEADD